MVISLYDKKATNQGVVLDLPMFEGVGSQLHDISKYHNNGTITGATWTQLPSGLWYLSFDDENDSIDCGADSSLNIRSAITLMHWWRPDTALQSVTLMKGAYNDGYHLDCRTSDSGSFNIKPAVGDLIFRYSTGGTLNEWAFHCGTYDGTDKDGLHVYLNGALSDLTTNGTGGGDIKDNSGVSLKFLIQGGRRNDGDAALIRIFNRVLTATEIASIFNQERILFGV